MSVPAIDMAGIVFDAEGWGEYLLGFARTAPNYLQVFERRFASMAGISRAEFRAASEDSPEALARLLGDSDSLGVDIDEHVNRLVSDGICHQVMLGAPGSRPKMNDRLADLAARHPSRLQAWAGLDLSDSDEAVRELNRCVQDRGMRGGTLVHFLGASDPLSTGCSNIYAEAERLGIPLWIHVGHHLSNSHPIDTCTWRHVDEIARAHPDLVLICGHAGWPWVLDLVSVCQRHRNVYLEFSTHRASNMSIPGSGWEPLLAYGQSTIRGKVLFGSVEYAHGLTARELADEVAALDLPPDVVSRWLHDNAAAVLGLDEHACTGSTPLDNGQAPLSPIPATQTTQGVAS